jgi:NADPH-dependent 2,4-dienoyl-CoA reductase/sulfur reductase-like enzyme
MSAAERLAETGAALELVTPERIIAPDVGGTNYPAYLKAFHGHGVTITLNHRLKAVERDGNRLKAVLGNDYTGARQARLVDQVVVEHGTAPLDELYFALKPGSRNGGEIDYDALLAGRPQEITANPDGRYQLFRVGDAVASRNIHAAIYDSLRLCKDL